MFKFGLYLSVLIVFVCGPQSISAHKKDKVIFKNYTTFETDMLRSIRETGEIGTFPGMRQLRRQALTVKENSLVAAKLKGGSTKQRDARVWVPQRRESVLRICEYQAGMVNPERVVIAASAMVLTKDGICISNYHVFSNMLDREAKLNPTDSLLFVVTDSNKRYPITRVLSFNRAGDIAVFKVDTHGDDLQPMPIGEDQPMAATVHTLTHPEFFQYYYSKGVVARNICTDDNNPFTNRADITADYARGSSGGAIFDNWGNLVGMVSTTQSIYATQSPVTTNLQMVVKAIIPISSILCLIEQSDKS